MSDSDKIQVRITASQHVNYDQIREMTRKEWEELKATPEREMENDGGPLSGWLDLGDVCGGDEFEDFDLNVVDDNGEPIKPRDGYGEANAL